MASENNNARQGFRLSANGGSITYIGVFKDGVTEGRITDILTRPNFNYANVVAPLLDLRDVEASGAMDDMADYASFEQGRDCGISWNVDLDSRTCEKIVINNGRGGVEDPDRDDNNYKSETLDLAKLSRAREAKAAYDSMARTGEISSNKETSNGIERI